MLYRLFNIITIPLFCILFSVRGNSKEILSDYSYHEYFNQIDTLSTPLCTPAMPSHGSNSWNVLAYNGTNNFDNANFQGYYQAVSEQEPKTFVKDGATVRSFKFKPSLDGWSALQSPSDALASKGAKTDYVGCSVPADGFSIKALRKGFPCGYYGGITVSNVRPTDGFKLRLDTEGDGVFDEILACNGCNGYPLGGFLGPKSIVEFEAYNTTDSFNIEILFEYVEPVTIGWADKSVVCKGESTLMYVGGAENYTWLPSIPRLDPTNPQSKIFVATPSVSTTYRAISDVGGCKDTVFIKVDVALPDTIRRDSMTCGPITTNPLTYKFKNRSGCDSIIFVNLKQLRKDTIHLPIQTKCNPSDTATIIKKLTNILGCDSLVIQRFRLSAADTVLRDSFVCTLPASNTKTYAFKNKSGCDSIVIVSLKQARKDTVYLPFIFKCNPTDTAALTTKFTNSIGCDSLVIQRFKLSSADTVRRDSVVCSLPASSTKTYKFKNISGCDSVIIVTLKQAKKDTTYLPILSKCNPADTATLTTKLINSGGCDSLVIQKFKLSAADTVRRDSVVCNSFNSNTLTYKFKNKNGCDSIEIVTLKQAKKDTTYLPILSKCNPADTATLTTKLTNSSGCDSLIIQKFKLSAADTVRRDSVVCNSFNSNTLTYKFKNKSGCDSIVIVTLKQAKQDTILLPILSRCNPADTVTKILNLKNSGGCDSIVIQKFRLSDADTVRRDSVVCSIPSNSTIKYAFKNKSGCDSIEIVTLKQAKQDTTLLPILSRCNPADTVTKILNLKNSGGCDSIVIQKFRLSDADTVRRDSVVCNSFNSNTLTYKFKNKSGCDSIVIVTLKQAKKDTTLLPILSRCNPADTVTKILNLKNSGGCDSIVIQKFILSAADTIKRDSFICNTFNNNTLTYKFKSKSGCDSIEIVTLKQVKKDSTILPILTRCNPRDTATQILSLKNSSGCDSIVIQKFRLSNADTIRRDSVVYALVNGKDTLVHRYKNNSGCDSIIIVSLKVLRCDTVILPALIRCDARDTVTKVTILKNSVGCDSTIIQPFKLAKKDTIIFNLTSCNERDTGQLVTVLTNQAGCDSIIIRHTTLIPSGIITQLKVEKNLICNSDTIGEISIKTPAGGQAPYQIAWNNGSTFERIRGLTAGTYTVSVTDARGCLVRDSINLAAPPPLSIATTIKPPRCFDEANGTITITRVNGGDAPFRFQYQNKNVVLPSLPYSISNLKADEYTFTIIDSKGCKTTESVNLAQPQKLAATFTDRLTSLKLGDSIELIPEFNFTPHTLKWTPPQYLNCDTCLRPIATPFKSTVFKVEAFDEKGCSVSQLVDIRINPERNVFVPNVFSPNGDGQNDYFTIFTDRTVSKVKVLEIFDRWGEKMFVNHDFQPNIENIGWEGTLNGKNVESGVYIYYCIVVYKDGQEGILQGQITLLR